MNPQGQSRMQEIISTSYLFIEFKFESIFKVKHRCVLKRRQLHKATTTTVKAQTCF